MSLRRPVGGILLLAALLLFSGACRRDRSASRLMVLGLDGLDPEIVATLGAAGRLPNLSRMRRDGASGSLRVDPPLLSPVIWTTIATGLPPERHGIGHFTARLPDGSEVPVTSSLRRTQAVWNIFSGLGRSVAVVGWWATWPAETVNGTMVSDRTCYHFLGERRADVTDPQLVYPVAAAAGILAQVVRPETLTATELARFVSATPQELERPVAFSEDLAHFRWALAAAHSYSQIGLELWRKDHPELLLVYVEATDTASHLFGHLYHQPGLAGELALQQRHFGGTVEATYVWADELVGRFMAAMDDRTTLVVLSDHGFELGTLPADPSTTRDLRRVTEKFHRELGSIFLYGRGVEPGATLADPRPVDVVPTLLALAGLPQADDLPGRPLLEGLQGSRPPFAHRASFEPTGETRQPRPAADAATDEAMLEKLRSLGYLAGAARSESSAKNLAAIELQAQRFPEAARAYAELLAERPGDPALETGLASALTELGRSEEALAHFAAALASDPLFVAAHHNRARLCERLGRRDEAIAGYRAALQIDSAHAASRRALERLGAPPSELVARNAADLQADALVREAGERLRRGDYDGADELLAQALALAPEAAPVYHQMSNVAYLRGDLQAAVAALERALALDPGNALFRTNLDRLRRRQSPPH